MANYPLNQTRPQTYEYNGERPPMVRQVTDRILDREKYKTPTAYAVGKVFTGATYTTGEPIDFDYLLEPGIRRFTINNKTSLTETSTATNIIKSETSELPFANTPYGGYIEVISPNHFEDAAESQNVERYRQNVYLDGYEDAKVWTRAGIKLARNEFTFPAHDNRHYNPTGNFTSDSSLYVVPVTEHGYGDILTDITLTNEPTIVSVTPNAINFGWEGGDQELTIDALTGVSVSIQDNDVDPSQNNDLSSVSFISCPSKLSFGPNKSSKKFNVVAKKDFYIYSINGVVLEKPEIPDTDPEEEDWYSLRSLLEYLNKISFGNAATIVVYFNGDNAVINRIYDKLKGEIDDALDGIWPNGFSRNLLDILNGKTLLLVKSVSLTSVDSFLNISTKIPNVAPFITSAMLLNRTAYAISDSEFQQPTNDLVLSGANGYVSYTRTSFALFPDPKTVTDNYTYVIDTPTIWWTPWEEVTNIDLSNKFKNLEAYVNSLNLSTKLDGIGNFTFRRLEGDIVSRDMSVYTGNNLMYLGTAKRQTIYYSFGDYYLELPDPNKVPIGTQIGLLQLSGVGHVFSTSLNQYSGVAKRYAVFQIINHQTPEEQVTSVYVQNINNQEEKIELTKENSTTYTCILDMDKKYHAYFKYHVPDGENTRDVTVHQDVNDLKENYKTIYTIDFSTGYDFFVTTYEYCDDIINYPLDRTEETTPIYQKSEYGLILKNDYDEPLILSGKLYLYTALRQNENTNNVTWVREKEEPSAYDLFTTLKTTVSNARLSVRKKQTKTIEVGAPKFEDMIRLRDEIGQYDMTYVVKEKKFGTKVDENADPIGKTESQLMTNCQVILYIPKDDFNANTYYWGLHYGEDETTTIEYRKLYLSNVAKIEQRPDIYDVNRDVYVFYLNANAEAAESSEYSVSFHLRVENQTNITEVYTEDPFNIENAFESDNSAETKLRVYIEEDLYESKFEGPNMFKITLSVSTIGVDSLLHSVIRLPNGYDLKDIVDDFNPSNDLVLFCSCLVMDYDNDGLVTLNDVDTAIEKFNRLKTYESSDGFSEFAEPAESSRETQILRIAYGLNLIGCIQQIYQLIRLVKLWIYKTQIHPAYENNIVAPVFILSKRKDVDYPLSKITFRGGYSLNEKINQNSFRLVVDRDEDYSDCDECDIVVPFTGDYKFPENNEAVSDCFWHYVAEL